MDNKDKNLYYLDELSDYKVASDDPDVRGWKVNDKDQRCVGTVSNLLVSKRDERVVYLDVEVDSTIIDVNHKPFTSALKNEGVHEFLNKDGENHLIIPIGLATLDKESKIVHTEKINHQTFAETKRKSKNQEIDRDYELFVLKSYDRETNTFPAGDEFYKDDKFKKRK